MVGQGRKWVQSTRLFNPRRFLTLRDPQLEASDLSGALKAALQPPHTSTGAQPGISGRIGEADSAQPTRNGPCHGRLGFWPGLGPYFAAVMRMRGALRTFGLGCTLPRGAAHTFEACNLTRTARLQCTDCIQPGDSDLSKCSVRDSPLRVALASIPGATAIGTKS